MTTPALFEKYPTPDALAEATADEVYDYISSVTFANNKSDYLVRMAKLLKTRYRGNIPADADKLQKLPGVGRKTAHVILATLFNKPVLAVDTHVARVSDRIGLTTGAGTPLETEEQLLLHTPQDVLPKMSHWLILHVVIYAQLKRQKCGKCEIREICRHYNTGE